MASKTLSSEIEKMIRHLCLTDFPCGNGSWRKSKDSGDGPETESADELLDLLKCPCSPWGQVDDSWSPQVSTLRELAVLTPERLRKNFIHNHFTTLRIVDKGVSVIDDGLLKFSKLEELVLSANLVTEIAVDRLPITLKVLELRANRLSSLSGLSSCRLPQLQYLSLGSNPIGLHEDVSHINGGKWPQLVCLDLSDCCFEDQQALVKALGTLSRLKTLVLEGNPFTLAPAYPGLTVDTLTQLAYLDGSEISPEERHHFRGLATMSDLKVDVALTTVSVGRMRGIPDPMMKVDGSELPFVTYKYFISYEFPNHRTPDNLDLACESVSDTKSTEQDDSTNTVSRHNTSKLMWSEVMDFSDSQTYTATSLRDFKTFLNCGLHLTLEEEKVASWPAACEDAPSAKSIQTVKEKKGRKGRESQDKLTSTKVKSTDKKGTAVQQLVHDAPIRRVLGSAHVPLHSLVRGERGLGVVCEFDLLHPDFEVDVAQTPQKDLEKDKNGDEEPKQRERSGKRQSVSHSKGKGSRKQYMNTPSENTMPVQRDPVTVELRVQLEKWGSASQANGLIQPHQHS
ncbi:leucine-rich repeat-containing protein 43 isoform X2 [Oryzias melastigma]|uniref:leucine-rich repeat-containing protein 43 isoform X2 n=1 Tax=Oryzias melastigma TaxID=30732 RepID=UPI000CF80D9F|nr:leucine-rich repeat-containing protein 43 isoform X2 [Oryzias melastigma]